jgi:acetyl esterase/lipase
MTIMMKHFAVALCATALLGAQEKQRPTELLWPSGAPGAVGTEDVDKPTLTIYLPNPAKAVGTGVVVCPGGGYVNLAMDHEGKQIAEWMNSLGVAAFVLKYRLGPRYHHPAMIDDAHQAIRIVRSRSSEFGIAPSRLGIMGFSAGGHLASTAATHFDAETRPDFAILIYPVISFTTKYVHEGSRNYLLGENPDPKLVESLSNELQVTPQTPPTFLFHTDTDTVVPPENSVLFYMALKRAGVPAEMHIFAEGEHGLGLAQTHADLSIWPTLLANWLRVRGLLGHPGR